MINRTMLARELCQLIYKNNFLRSPRMTAKYKSCNKQPRKKNSSRCNHRCVIMKRKCLKIIVENNETRHKRLKKNKKKKVAVKWIVSPFICVVKLFCRLIRENC